MKLARFASASALSLLLGTFLLVTPVLVCAQDQRDEAKPSQPEPRPEEKAKPAQDPRQGEAKPAEQGEDKPARGEDKPAKQEDKQAEHSGQSTEHAHNGTPGQRGGHIPDDKFRATFGHQHTFVMQRPTTDGGQPRFQYGGYWFALVDAWPADWAYTDECYIDYIDGEYFLIDVAHPGI